MSQTDQTHASSIVRFSGGFGILSWQSFQELFTRPFHWRLVSDQIYRIGVESFLLVTVTALATGSVMALQFGYGIERFGGKLYVPKVVALSILREMGPVFTSLLVAGRVGSGIAAEVASMKVTQQIDAMRALGTSPVKRIVLPRLLACMFALPVLTLLRITSDFWVPHLSATGELGISYAFLPEDV